MALTLYMLFPIEALVDWNIYSLMSPCWLVVDPIFINVNTIQNPIKDDWVNMLFLFGQDLIEIPMRSIVDTPLVIKYGNRNPQSKNEMDV